MGARLGAIALLAMLVRAIVPAGYMLAQADTGQGRFLTVEMCEGHAAKVIDLNTGKQVDPSSLSGEAPEEGEDRSQNAPCVFASTASLATPGATAEPVEFLATQAVEFGVDLNIRPGRGIAAPPPPSTGPPSAV
ncbi:MAG TPA: DUF2946 family protein [Hyphomonadaceae bacterium]